MITRRPPQKLIAEINITPFTDVILVLLIIFMVATPLLLQSRIQIQLPKAASAEPFDRNQSQTNITVTGEGLIYLDDVLVTRAELKEKMQKRTAENPDQEVFLSSDRNVRVRDVVDIMDVLTGLGLTKLGLVTTTGQ